jgi:tripartite-type tricarboxylate transporter receptor subunit TctC
MMMTKRYMMTKFKFLALAWCLSISMTWAKTVEMVVPFAPGGTADQVTQAVLYHSKPEFAKHGITLNIAYRPGAGGVLASNSVARGTAGKLQILMANNSIISATLFNTDAVNYNLTQDFVLLNYIGYTPMMVVVNPVSKISDAAEFVAACQRRVLNFGTSGVGSNGHIAGQLASTLMACRTNAVPYKGQAPAVNDLLGGHIDYVADFIAGVTQHIETKKLTPIVALAPQRLPEFPTVPTITEVTKKDYNFTAWWALLANANADSDDLNLARKILTDTLASPQVRERLREIGIRQRRDNRSDFLVQEREIFLKLINDTKLK